SLEDWLPVNILQKILAIHPPDVAIMARMLISGLK
ncbi:hypothetical protein A2U01_0103960, partial [Trifolium medium]|nr:hypothetical protein [Trifolium medium]